MGITSGLDWHWGGKWIIHGSWSGCGRTQEESWAGASPTGRMGSPRRGTIVQEWKRMGKIGKPRDAKMTTPFLFVNKVRHNFIITFILFLTAIRTLSPWWDLVHNLQSPDDKTALKKSIGATIWEIQYLLYAGFVLNACYYGYFCIFLCVTGYI